MRHRIPAIAAAAGLAALVGSLPVRAGETTAVRYDGHRVVRVDLDSEAELTLMRTISPDCWCENLGVGVLDFRVPPDAMPILDVSGIDYTVIIDDVQTRIDAERARINAAAAGGGGSWFDEFKTFDEIVARLQALVAAHPDIAELIDIGDSLEGRDIWAIRITGGDGDEPGVLYNGCQHAREWISPMVNMYIVDRLLNGYGVEPQITSLVDGIEFFVVPVVNPDGYVYSWDVERLWRKNRRDNGDGTFGVDPNRNWGFEWGGEGAGTNGSDEDFRGAAPFSEPETQALSQFYVANPNIVASIDFHSYSQLILYPWAYQGGGPGDGGTHAVIGGEMAATILGVNGLTYEPGNVYDTLYPASGGSIDWTWGDQGVISYTVELRPTGSPGFMLPASEIIPTAEENLPAALVMAEAATTGVLYRFPGGLPGVVAADAETAIEVEITSVTAGPLATESAQLFWREGVVGSFASAPLVHDGGTSFTASIPTVTCGATIEYYFEILSSTGTPFRSPLGAPDGTHQAAATVITTAFTDDFENDLGWSVEDIDLLDGGWDRGVPAGGGDRGDPAFDFDGSGGCYLTDNVDGNSDVDGGPTRLTSPTIDGTTLADPMLGYARWFSNDDGDADSIDVELSGDDGASWTLVDSGTGNTGWVEVTLRVADFMPPTATMRVRFTATDNPNDSVTEAAVDAVRLFESGCPAGPPIPGDLDADGDVDFVDLLEMLSLWGPCAGCPADLDGDGLVAFTDLLTLLANWG